jgi:hypothetical protein
VSVLPLVAAPAEHRERHGQQAERQKCLPKIPVPFWHETQLLLIECRVPPVPALLDYDRAANGFRLNLSYRQRL